MSATVTAANNAANLKTAKRNVLAAMGLAADFDTSTFDYSTRATYTKALASEILKYPQSFTDGTLQSAQLIAAKSYGELADPSFSWGEFGNAFADEAKITLPRVGLYLLAAGVILGAVFIFVRYKPASIKPGIA